MNKIFITLSISIAIGFIATVRAQVIEKDGNIGIGTDSPTDAKLHVVGDYNLRLDPSHGTLSYYYITSNSSDNIIGTNIRTKIGAWDVPDKTKSSAYINFTTYGIDNSSDGGIFFSTRAAGQQTNLGTTQMAILNNGRVGIGTSNPLYQLDVYRSLRVYSPVSYADTEALIKIAYVYDGTAANRSARLELGSQENKGEEYYGKIWSIESLSTATWANGPEFRINNGYNTFLRINYFGNVGIGVAPSTSNKLEVNGTIRSKEIKVDAIGWPDYVFEDGYKLRELKEVGVFVTENKHLPDLPSAAHLETNGVNLAEMNKLLLQKVEELTLYLLQQQKEIDNLKTAVFNSGK